MAWTELFVGGRGTYGAAMATGERQADSGLRHDRTFWSVWGWVLVAVVVGFFVAWQFVGEPPPRRLVVATGVAGGGYARGGEALREAMAASGIEVELRATVGTVENLDLLRAGEVDLAFVQGGVAERTDDLRAVASLYFEPFWVFVRDGVVGGAEATAAAHQLGDLGGLRLQVGAEGSGSRSVALKLLVGSGVDLASATLLGDGPDAAATSLEQGRCDAVMFVAEPRSAVVRRLFEMEGVHPMSLARSVAYSRHFAFLEPLELSPGLIDLADDVPSVAVQIVAPAAGWVMRPDLHPAIAPLLIEAAEQIYGGRGRFEDEGTFPNPRGADFPIAEAAEHYFRRGPSFLYRILPFQVAATLDRLKIMLLPLLTLLIPLVKIAPPVYRWRTRSRITRWYRYLRDAEAAMRADPSPAGRARARAAMDRLDEEVAEVQVPLGYAEELYNVRMHLQLVRRSLEAPETTGDGPPDPDGGAGPGRAVPSL